MKHRILSLFLFLTMVLGLIPAMALTASAATNGRTQDEAVAWILALENTAMDYNGWSPNNRQTNGQKRTAQIHDFSCVIRPDWPSAPAQSSEQVCDLGNFYGRIGYNGGWLHTTGAPIPDGSGKGMDVRITTKSDLTDPSQVWQFIKQSNGSYKIVNMATKWCLDVQTGKVRDGGNVWVWSIDHGDVPERWLIVQAAGQSGFRLVSAIDNRFCLDIPGGDVHEGANAEIYPRNTNSWQFFTITEIRDYDPNPAPAKPEAVTVRTAPSASSITLGQSLASSHLSGGSVVSATGTSVPGTWSWSSPDIKPAATGKYDAVFAPADASKYTSTTLKVSLTVTDPCAKATATAVGRCDS